MEWTLVGIVGATILSFYTQHCLIRNLEDRVGRLERHLTGPQTESMLAALEKFRSALNKMSEPQKTEFDSLTAKETEAK